MTELLVNAKLETMWKKASVAYWLSAVTEATSRGSG
jgi:hypothetical protein